MLQNFQQKRIWLCYQQIDNEPSSEEEKEEV